MQNIELANISVDKIALPEFNNKNIDVSVLRLDKIHQYVSGNKWFKLKYYLDDALQQNKSTIVTFGGAWSNHILATAAICKINNLKSIGIIRGEKARQLSFTLNVAETLGMELFFTNRTDYAEKIIPEEFNKPENYFIEEGGYGAMGAHGAATILEYCQKETFSHICCAAGTGTMIAGIINASVPANQIIGVSVLKNNFSLNGSIISLLKNKNKDFRIIDDFHFGGYAKYTPVLLQFMNDFFRQTSIPSDFVYTGKLFYAVNELIKQNFFPEGSRLLVIHSGGLQGNNSLNKGTLIFLNY
jgi:1-aminocyclopropane-1-carboxylate deaminase